MTLLDRLTNCCPRKSVPDCASKMCIKCVHILSFEFTNFPIGHDVDGDDDAGDEGGVGALGPGY